MYAARSRYIRRIGLSPPSLPPTLFLSPIRTYTRALEAGRDRLALDGFCHEDASDRLFYLKPLASHVIERSSLSRSVRALFTSSRAENYNAIFGRSGRDSELMEHITMPYGHPSRERWELASGRSGDKRAKRLARSAD